MKPPRSSRPRPADPERTAPLGRPARQRAAVAEALRERILSGRWEPGERLPPRTRLIRELKTTATTLQSALNLLIADDLVVTRGAHGTFIHDRPPHRCRYGMVFPNAPGEDSFWNRFWEALVRAAQVRSSPDGRRIEVFYGPHRRAGSDSFRQLVEGCRQRRFAGLFIVSSEKMYLDTPVFDAAIPRVLLSQTSAAHADATVNQDWPSFRRLAIATLAQRGCRKLAVIAGAGLLSDAPGEARAWSALAESAGMRLDERRIFGLDISYPAPTANLVRFLVSRRDDLPDGLVVADDNLLAPVLAGLAAEGLEPGRDIHLVAHANFPLPAGEPRQIPRIGFDAAAMLDLVMDLFERIRIRQAMPAQPALIAAELRAGDGL